MTATRAPEWLARMLAAPGFLVPAAMYLALALFPGLWSAGTRGQLVGQFFIIEFCVGMLIGALCRLATGSAPWLISVGRWVVLVVTVAGLAAVAWTTRDIGIAVLIGAPVLPRVIETFRRIQQGRRDASLCTDGILSLAGVFLIGIPYLLLHTPAPGGPADVLSVPPPLALTATAMALHYLVLAYATGQPKGDGQPLGN